MLKFTFVFLIGATLSPLAAAELRFETAPAPVLAAPDAGVVELSFPFEVVGEDGDSPVHIEAITSSCKCLSATADREDRTYPAGSRGVITASFELANTVGIQEQTLTITTSAGDQPIPLTAQAQVPELIITEADSLEWRPEERTERTMGIRTEGDAPLALTGVTSGLSWLDLRVEAVEAGREYRLHARPKEGGAQAGIGLVQLSFDHPHPRYQTRTFYVLVRG